MKVSIELIKQLREETQASVADCRNALEKSNGDLNNARQILRKKGFERAEKKAVRATREGRVEAYVHQNSKIGALIELLCETDFVARTGEFKNLAHELAMQTAAMAPGDVESLLKQEYIRDPSITIEDLVKGTIAKLGENITIKRMARFEIGGE